VAAFRDLPRLSYQWIIFISDAGNIGKERMDSLIPYATVNSVRLSLEMSRFISSIGTGAAPATPVLYNTCQNVDMLIADCAYRSLLKSSFWPACCLFSTSVRTDRKCVGTPCRTVHFSSTTASTIAAASKVFDGYTTQDPCDHAARFPRTKRREWERKLVL
jgi:hypothetical protein